MNVYNIVDITPSFPYPSNTPIPSFTHQK